MGRDHATLIVKLVLAAVALAFVFLLLNVEEAGSWFLGLSLIWILVGVATLVLVTRRRPRRSRPRGRPILSRRLESHRTHIGQSPRVLEGQRPTKYLTEKRD
jgi:hypothetical protein